MLAGADAGRGGDSCRVGDPALRLHRTGRQRNTQRTG